MKGNLVFRSNYYLMSFCIDAVQKVSMPFFNFVQAILRIISLNNFKKLVRLVISNKEIRIDFDKLLPILCSLNLPFL